MNKRDLMLSFLDGTLPQKTDEYTPAAFFLHFGADSKLGPGAITKHRDFFDYTGMDFVKIQYELPFPAQVIQRPEDWGKVPALSRDFFQPQLDVVRALVEELKSEALVVVTLYSPFMCAGNVGGRDVLTTHLREDPDSVRPGMAAVTESLKVFVRECISLGVDGFYHSTQGGESRRFADRRIFLDYIKPADLALLEEIDDRCPFNILHVCDYHREQWGGYDDITPFLDYPGQVVNSSLEVGEGGMIATEISRLFQRPFMGGMDRMGPLAAGTAEEVRQAAGDALFDAPERFILGADCTVPNDTPWENLRTAIEVAHRSLLTN